MTRTEVYQLRLSSAEKAALAHLAAREGLSIARMIRRRFGLASDPSPVAGVAKLPALSGDPVTARQKVEVRKAVARGEYEVKVEVGTAAPSAAKAPAPEPRPTPPPAKPVAPPVASPGNDSRRAEDKG